MLISSIVLALFGAASVAATDRHVIRSIVNTRQLTSDTVPAACSSTCQTAINIYSACQSVASATSPAADTCLSVCQTSVFNEFVGCINCITQNTPGLSSSFYSQLNSAISTLRSACASAGQTVTGASSLNALSSGTAAASRTSTAAATGAVTQATSSTSGVTITAGGSSTAETSGSALPVGGVSSVSSVLNSVTSAAATSARSAAIATTGFNGWVISAFIGAMGIGAAVVL